LQFVRRCRNIVTVPSAVAPTQFSNAAFAAARSICRRHAKSFYFASHRLPKKKRLASYAVYAFCRLLDDAVDTRPGREQEGIEEFEALLTKIFIDDIADLPADEQGLALRAFHTTVREYNIPRRYFDDLATGCRMDLTVTRYETWAELE
jgi:phytoene synthase